MNEILDVSYPWIIIWMILFIGVLIFVVYQLFQIDQSDLAKLLIVTGGCSIILSFVAGLYMSSNQSLKEKVSNGETPDTIYIVGAKEIKEYKGLVIESNSDEIVFYDEDGLKHTILQSGIIKREDKENGTEKE